MTIGTESNRNDYLGNGAASSYQYTFRIFEADDIQIFVRDTDDLLALDILLTEGIDYSVNNVGELSGGTIDLIDNGQAWLDSGNLDLLQSLTILRKVDLKQGTDLRNQGDFFPEAHEDTFDKSRMIDQQQQEELNRSVKLPESVPAEDFDARLPAGIVDVPGVSIITGPIGKKFIVGPTADEIANAQAYALEAKDHRVTAERFASEVENTTVVDEFTDVDTGLFSALHHSAKAQAAQSAAEAAQAAAEAAQSAAEAEAAAALASAAAALASEVAAALSETNAGLSETAAAASESAAGASASAALASEIAAAASAAAALISEGNAATSETNAGTSETNAGTSETNAAASESAAAISEANALAAAAASNWNDVMFLTFADSPFTAVDGDAGTLFNIDASGGNFIFNLPIISGLSLTAPWSVSIKKSSTDSSENNITINQDAADEIDEVAASYVITETDAGVTLVPDTDPIPDSWTSMPFGIAISSKIDIVKENIVPLAAATTITFTEEFIFDSLGNKFFRNGVLLTRRISPATAFSVDPIIAPSEYKEVDLGSNSLQIEVNPLVPATGTTEFSMDQQRTAIGSPDNLTTKGDLLTFDTADSLLSVGADGEVLTADSAESKGVKWQAPVSTGGVEVGTILSFGGAAAPAGYVICDGSLLSRATYAGLYAALGDAFGNGDGSTTFLIPDLRGNFLRGTDNGATQDPDAAGRIASGIGGNTGDNVGSYQADEIDSHTHTGQLQNATGNAVTPAAVNSFAIYTGAGNPFHGSNPSHSINVMNNTGGNETRPRNVNVNYIVKY